MEKLLAEALVRDVPDFPKPGILFKDITPVLQDYDALKQVIDKMTEQSRPLKVDVVVGIEARGFIFGAPLALELEVGFVPLRKLGKLPYNRLVEEYALEYGTNTVEIHTDSIKPGQRVLIVDDVLATGGTAAAAARLVERAGGQVTGLCFLIELDFLEGRKALENYPIISLIHYQE
jgi:adenine phosphoribosyltransferase